MYAILPRTVPHGGELQRSVTCLVRVAELATAIPQLSLRRACGCGFPSRLSEVEPYYSTGFGMALLGDALHVMRRLRAESVDLILTSPPYPLIRKKAYGNVHACAYLAWFAPFAAEIVRILKDSGSLVLCLGGVWNRRLPTKSAYQFELLLFLTRFLHLAQDFYVCNPAKIPGPAEWVNVRRIRAKDAVDYVWWLSKTPYPKASNTKVLRPYSDSMKILLRRGSKRAERPSGHILTKKIGQNNGGAIPPNFLLVPNTISTDAYLRQCRIEGIQPHPARLPRQLPEFFIKFLTDEHDIVLDPFAGSNVTGEVAEALGRHWVAVENVKRYLTGSKLRFGLELEAPRSRQATLRCWVR